MAWQWTRTLAVVAVAVAAAVGGATATNIESDGFSLDGSTTYCMGIGSGGSAGSLTFDSLLASNAGRCPVGVSISLESTQAHVSTTFTVSWEAKVDKSVTSGIFPNAIDSTTGLPDAVTTSLMWACTAGTNCGTNIAGAPTGSGGSSSGAFDSDGTKQLADNAFTLTTEGSYILVGLVQLPGDSSLDISAEEYLIFKTITIVSADTTITPTPTTATPTSTSSSANGSGSATTAPATTAPTTSSNSTSTGSDTSVSATAGSSSTPGTVKPSAGTADSSASSSSGSSSTVSASTGSSGFFASNAVMLIALLAGGCVICAVGFVMFMRHRKEAHTRANKRYDLGSPSMDAVMGGGVAAAAVGGSRKKRKSKVDLGYVANISARNTDRSNGIGMMSDDTVVMLASAERGSELNASSAGGSIRHSSVDAGSVHQYDSNRDIEAASAATAAAVAAATAPRDPSNVSELSSLASDMPQDDDTHSMSNFGDSVVDESQHHYLQSFDWKDSQFSRDGDSMLDSDDQAAFHARGYSTGNFSTVSGYSDVSRNTSMSNDDARNTAFSDARLDSEISVDSNRHTNYSDATRMSRLDSEVSVDSYTFRPSRESTDSYGSGMSPYSRQGSRISGMSAYSDVSSTK